MIKKDGYDERRLKSHLWRAQSLPAQTCKNGMLKEMLVDTVIGTSTYVKNTDYDAAGRMEVRDLGLTGNNPVTMTPLMAEVQSETGWSHEIIIIYTYDLLNRLREASYNDGSQFEYTYDAAGNRLTQTIDPGPGNPVTTTYDYDIANRLTYVNAQLYTWDNNGNLLNDGVSTYTYNHANRLVSLSGNGILTTSYSYNGLGDRLEQTNMIEVVEYTLDLTGGLTQVLSDGTHFYLYGDGRIGEQWLTNWLYHLGEGLGSVRQLTDHPGLVTLAKGYEPYGEVMESAGGTSTPYGFAGEWTDNTGLVYLRARYYDPTTGRFMTRDIWGMWVHAYNG